MNVSARAKSGFGLQVNTYRDFANVLETVAKLDAVFNEPILVAISQVGGATAFKVIVGAFNSANDARNLTNRVKSLGFNPFVKSLSTL